MDEIFEYLIWKQRLKNAISEFEFWIYRLNGNGNTLNIFTKKAWSVFYDNVIGAFKISDECYEKNILWSEKFAIKPPPHLN